MADYREHGPFANALPASEPPEAETAQMSQEVAQQQSPHSPHNVALLSSTPEGMEIAEVAYGQADRLEQVKMELAELVRQLGSVWGASSGEVPF